jgi:hypothetical protein
MKVNELDVVELNDSRVVTVVHVYKDHVAYECEDNSVTGAPGYDCEYDGDLTFTVKPDQIQRIVQEFASIKDSGK